MELTVVMENAQFCDKLEHFNQNLYWVNLEEFLCEVLKVLKVSMLKVHCFKPVILNRHPKAFSKFFVIFIFALELNKTCADFSNNFIIQ